jgi:hypothetical protein
MEYSDRYDFLYEVISEKTHFPNPTRYGKASTMGAATEAFKKIGKSI